MNTLISSSSISTPSEMIALMIRAIDTRIKFEETTQGAAKTIKQLTGLLKKAERMDNFTLSYMIENSVDFDGYVNSSKQHGTRANIYSITKLWETCRVLHGANFDDMESNDHPTLAATLVGLHEGVVNQKRLQNRIDDIMTGVRRFQMFTSSTHAAKLEAYLAGKVYSYSAGNTQGGSSLRALEALGIVKETGREGTCKTWGFCDDSEKVKHLIESAYAALSKNMFKTEQDQNYVKKTETAPAIPEVITIHIAAFHAVPAQDMQEDSTLNEARESLLHSLALMQADSDGMGQAIVSVPEKQEETKQEATRGPIDILDKEAMAKEAARQKKEKQERANAKRKATIAAKKAKQESLSV